MTRKLARGALVRAAVRWSAVARVLAALLAAAAALGAPRAAFGADVKVHGLLDLVATGRSETAELNEMWLGDSRFDAYAARVFVDGAVNDRVQVFTQLLVTEVPGVRAMGAYAMIEPWKGRDVHVLAGLIPYLVGTYEERVYSDKNPLVGIPMLYHHHTTLLWYEIPATADQLLAHAGADYRGVDYPSGGAGVPGMPVIYETWWDFGVGVTGSARPLEFA